MPHLALLLLLDQRPQRDLVAVGEFSGIERAGLLLDDLLPREPVSLGQTWGIPADITAGLLAIGLGCELKHAAKLVYSRGLDLSHPVATPIGPACRICERPACPQRAVEPLGRALTVDDFTKSVSPYPFAP